MNIGVACRLFEREHVTPTLLHAVLGTSFPMNAEASFDAQGLTPLQFLTESDRFQDTFGAGLDEAIMDLITTNTLTDYVSTGRQTAAPSVSQLVERALLLERKGLYGHEQRGADRYPYSRLVELTPYDPAQEVVTGDTITVSCRNLSMRGLGFYHRNPLNDRYALVQLHPGTDAPEMLMKLVWCRFLKPEWYDNGGRFVRISSSVR